MQVRPQPQIPYLFKDSYKEITIRNPKNVVRVQGLGLGFRVWGLAGSTFREAGRHFPGFAFIGPMPGFVEKSVRFAKP